MAMQDITVVNVMVRALHIQPAHIVEVVVVIGIDERLNNKYLVALVEVVAV
jgi:hypothetical protein